MQLCLTADNLENITWWVDTSYAVHWDSRSHTGMVMHFGLGAVMSGSWRQKLNTGSSTEAELVGIDDALKYIMWGLYFIQAQGSLQSRSYVREQELQMKMTGVS